ncbi:MAG: HNH endonuclease [Bacteroidota bacterium]
MLTANNLLWVKNVKRDQGQAWAYMEHQIGDVVDLHFPNNDKWYPTNYERPSIGECILIFQTVNADVGMEVTFLTHIVTPVTDYIEVDPNAIRKYRRKVCVVAKSENGVPKPFDWSFFKVNRGQICSLTTLERNGVNPGLDATQILFWNLFGGANIILDPKFPSSIYDKEDEELLAVEEGRERRFLKMHKIIERNRKIVEQKKRLAVANGTLNCEVCQFDFEKTYSSIGRNFIECHHKVPIAVGGVVITTVESLALVCPNCHRMLHRKNEKGEYYSISELSLIVQSQR